MGVVSVQTQVRMHVCMDWAVPEAPPSSQHAPPPPIHAGDEVGGVSHSDDADSTQPHLDQLAQSGTGHRLVSGRPELSSLRSGRHLG